MREFQNLFQAIKMVVKQYPSFLIAKIILIITGIIKVICPVYVIQIIINVFISSEEANITQARNQCIIFIGIIFLVLAVIDIIEVYISYYIEHLHRLFVAKAQIKLFNKFSCVDYEYSENPNFLNDYTRSLEDGVENIYLTTDAFFTIIIKIFQSFSMLAIIYTMNKFVIFIAILLGLLYGVLRYFIGKLSYKASSLQRPYRRQTRYNLRAFALKESQEDLKTSDIGQLLLESNDLSWNKIIKIGDKYYIWKSFISFIGECLLGLLYPLILGMLVFFSTKEEGSYNLSSFAALTVAATALSGLISNLATAVGDVQQSVVECRIPFELLKMDSKIENNNGRTMCDHFEGLSIKEVSFIYPNSDKKQLTDINITIRKGQKIAIVGANGAGKTTLVKLLLRLYDATTGSIYYNDSLYQDINVNSLRKKIGAVFQNVEVYALSIAENILLKKPKSEEDFSLLEQAISFAGLSEFVAKQPNGYNTQITREFAKNGTVFSGGIKQRLAIARGYAQGYELFLLDEPSSSLDPIAEANVFNNMLSLGKDKTIVFISHRLTTCVNADYIYVMDNGKIIEEGKHLDLINNHGLYEKMFISQASKYLGESENE